MNPAASAQTLCLALVVTASLARAQTPTTVTSGPQMFPPPSMKLLTRGVRLGASIEPGGYYLGCQEWSPDLSLGLHLGMSARAGYKFGRDAAVVQIRGVVSAQIDARKGKSSFVAVAGAQISVLWENLSTSNSGFFIGPAADYHHFWAEMSGQETVRGSGWFPGVELGGLFHQPEKDMTVRLSFHLSAIWYHAGANGRQFHMVPMLLLGFGWDVVPGATARQLHPESKLWPG